VKDKLYEKQFRIPFLGRELTISFELFINKIKSDTWQNVTNIGIMGDRIPGVCVTARKELYISLTICRKSGEQMDQGGNFTKTYRGQKVSKLRRTEYEKLCIFIFKYNFEVLLNDWSAWLEENTIPALYDKPRYPTVHGKIKKLKFISLKGIQRPEERPH